jgi:hypothetical protein
MASPQPNDSWSVPLLVIEYTTIAIGVIMVMVVFLMR